MAASSPLAVGDLLLDAEALTALVAGRPLALTRKEFALLLWLARHPGQVVTHEALLARAWRDTPGGGLESLRVHINQVRKKLGVGSGRPRLVTVPGVGYRLAFPGTGGPSPER